MTQAGDAMKLASKEGISLKEAWARIKGRPVSKVEEAETTPAFNTGDW